MTLFRKINRLLAKILLLVLVVTILFVTAGYIIGRYYGDEVKEYSIDQLNERLEIKVSVSEIDLSLFSKFPYLSVVLKNVIAWSGDEINPEAFDIASDTLFSADKIYLQFNMFEIIRGKFHIRRIHANDGRLNLLVDSEGKVNYKLFKNNKSDRSGKEIALEGVRLQNFNVGFINLAKALYINGYISDLMFKGRFISDNFDMATAASFRLINVSREGIQYAGNSDVSLRLILNIKGDKALISKGELIYNNLNMGMTGSFGIGSVSDMDINLVGRNFDLHSMFLSLPEYQREKLPLDISGKGNIAVKILGKLSRLEVPAIKAVYLLNISKVKYEELQFQNIDLKGSFSNGRLKNPYSSSVNIESYSIKDFRSELNGSFNLVNLKEPFFKLVVKGKFDGSVINEFYKSDKISNFKGILFPDLSIEAHFKSLNEFDAGKILSGGLEGLVEFKDFGFVLGKDNDLHSINGITRFSGDTWFPEFECQLDKGKIKTSLQLDNMLEYFSERKASLWISGNARANDIDLSKFFIREEGKSKSGFINFPDRMNMKLDIEVDNLIAGKFKADNIKTYLQYKPGYMSLSPISISGMEGKMNGVVALIQDHNNNTFINVQADIKGFNIHKVFYSFNDFNQNFITHKNLRGYISGSVELLTAFDSSMVVIRDEILTNADIIIRSGELIDFEPIKKLSRFVNLKELEHVYFSTIENKIVIKNKSIIINRMDIHSNAFNLSVAGTHDFDNRFSYKLKVNMSEILAGKAGKAKKENLEFGVIEAGVRGTNLYLSVYGTPEDFKIKYDQKEAVSQIKQDLKVEKTNLKSILNEEFGWFKKDSAIVNKSDRKDQNFILDWEEDSIVEPKTGTKKKKDSTNEEKIQFEWDESDEK